MSFCCVRRAGPKARNQVRHTSRKYVGLTRCTLSIAGLALLMGAQAWATDRALLDRCQTQLAACYETCKSQGAAPKLCSNKCTTDQCGLPWREGYGAFLDRRIEESAAPVTTAFVGLQRIKGRAAPQLTTALPARAAAQEPSMSANMSCETSNCGADGSRLFRNEGMAGIGDDHNGDTIPQH
jgi:hypothetical protein